MSRGFNGWLERRMMTPLPDNYVTDGLVFWLDGIDKGGTERHWIDKIGNVDFIGDTSTAPTALYNCFSFDGSQYLYDNTYTPPASGTGSIEVVMETSVNDAGQTLFFPKTGATRTSLYINASGRVFLGGGSSTSRKTYNATIPLNTKFSISMHNAAGYFNGTSMTAGSNSYVGGANSYNYIGKRRSQGDSSGNYFFTGKIYSIRLYSKQLSAAEVAANLAVDNVRFNMGLTL